MMSGLRVVSLFLGYSVIGLGGDYDVQVHVDPEIVVDVQVRQGSGDCSYEMTREFSLDVSAGTSLTLEEIAGKLSIEGREGLPKTNFFKMCAHQRVFQESYRAITDGWVFTSGASGWHGFL